MEDSDNKPESAKSRLRKRLAPLVGGIGVFSSGASAEGGSHRSSSTASNGSNGVQLGDFETGLDGWTTNGGNELTRITKDQIPSGVVSGEHGLAVEINGDLFPMIENKKRIKDADFLKNPHLQMHVIAIAEETDSDLMFQFRLHHTPSNRGGAPGKGGKGGSSGSKDVNVEESDLKTVPQLTSRTVQWDMSGLPDDVLGTAKRLEIVWFLEDHEPQDGHRGRANGDFDYQGHVVFDDIRLAESNPISETGKAQRIQMDLHREHGMIVDQIREEMTKDLERGTFVFADGTEIPYEAKILDNGQVRYTIDGKTHER